MSIDPEKFTQQVKKLLSHAIGLAIEKGNCNCTVLHLAQAVFSDQNSLAATLVERLSSGSSAIILVSPYGIRKTFADMLVPPYPSTF